MGGKPTPKVYDILMSLDYGVCYGPVNSVNMVWVKDKPIFCGLVDGRRDEYVNQPELFGGDDGEGGVKGTVEFYLGTEDQKSSPSLAARFDLTPDTMVGYRDICHLFFRGGRPGQDPFDTGSQQTIVAQDGDVRGYEKGDCEKKAEFEYPPKVTQRNAEWSGTGFRWMTNNPYMPATKVNVTRLPGINTPTVPGADAMWGEIWPPPTGDEPDDGPGGPETTLVVDDSRGKEGFCVETGFYWGNSQSSEGNIVGVDLLADAVRRDFGTNREKLEAGGIEICADMQATVELGGLGAGLDTGVILTVTYEALNDRGELIEQSSIASDIGEGTAVLNECRELPPSTRYVKTSTKVETSALSLFVSSIDVDPPSVEVKIPKYTYKFCETDGIGRLPDANPAFFLYEAMTNSAWGKGEPGELMDAPSFAQAAETLFNERFGISFIWVEQEKIENICQEVLDHIKAALYQSPRTGLWTLKLLRNDYDRNTLPFLTPSNCTLADRKRRAWGETVNEIVVSYTDPKNEKDSTVAAHNLANIQIQGGINSETRDYYMIRNAPLAQRVANRDVQEAGYPLYTAKAFCDRSFWDVEPGSVWRLYYPEDGIEEMVVRVMGVKYGDDKDREVELNLMEDIFSVEATAYLAPQESAAEEPGRPEPLTFSGAMTAPAPVLVRNGLSIEDIDEGYPEVQMSVFGHHSGLRVLDVKAVAPTVKPNGSNQMKAVATFTPKPAIPLPDRLRQEAFSGLPRGLVSRIFPGGPDEGDLLMVGQTEDEHELMMLDVFIPGLDVWRVIRGVYDTIPQVWDAGNRIFAAPRTTSHMDSHTRAAGEDVTYRLLPRVDSRRLDFAAAPDLSVTATERPHAPFRPANTSVGGQGFFAYEVGPEDSAPATVEATWANRNRTVEDASVYAWDDSSSTAEPGQTTRLRLTDNDGNVKREFAFLEGTSFDIPIGELFQVGQGYVEFCSERDGILSWSASKRRFVASNMGYGLDYGRDYGYGHGLGNTGYGKNYGEGYG